MDECQDGDRHHSSSLSDSAGPEEREAEVRGQQFPAPRLHLELRSPAADLGEPTPQRPEHSVHGRQRPRGCL